MATDKQTEANRLNAQHSTGPRTQEGKSATRFNALKHGIFSEGHTIIREDRHDFDALRDDYLRRFQPEGPEEETLVGNLVHDSWQRYRFRKIDADIWNNRLQEGRRGEPHPLGVVNPLVYKQLDYLQRRINSTHRQFHRDLDLLLKLQAARKLGCVSPGKAAPAPEPDPQPQPAQPLDPEIGFVPANPVIAPSSPLKPEGPLHEDRTG